MNGVETRLARDEDAAAIWPIFHAVIANGDTYAYPPDSSFEDFCALWFNERQRTYVALQAERVVGTYILKPNQPGLGAHVANAGYMTDPAARGAGIGSAMCRHSIEEARRIGFRSMQFNLVVSSNAGAIRLWRRHGFEIIGTVPCGFQHRTLGEIDAHIMFRRL